MKDVENSRIKNQNRHTARSVYLACLMRKLLNMALFSHDSNSVFFIHGGGIRLEDMQNE